MFLFFAILCCFVVRTTAYPYVADSRDCYDVTNTTQPTSLPCSTLIHCDCALCRKVVRSGIADNNDQYCIALSPTLNASEWNCSTPFNLTTYTECEQRNAAMRTTFVTIFVLVGIIAALICTVCVIACVFGACQNYFDNSRGRGGGRGRDSSDGSIKRGKTREWRQGYAGDDEYEQIE